MIWYYKIELIYLLLPFPSQFIPCVPLQLMGLGGLFMLGTIQKLGGKNELN